jgi:hypothetical protein
MVARPRGRAAVPHGHWKTAAPLPGLRYDGIAALMVLDGPTQSSRSSALVALLISSCLPIEA